VTINPVYSNSVDITKTDSEVIINFKMKEKDQENLISKIVLNVNTASALFNELQQSFGVSGQSSHTITAALRKAKVLVVEDNANYRTEIVAYLNRNNFDVYETSNGDNAVKMIDKINPDVILMDHIMPVLNGLDAAKVIKLDPEHQHTKIYLLIGYGKVTDFSDIMGNVIYKLLPKPINLEELKKEIESV